MLDKVIRFFWHAFFYIFMPPQMRRYALTCKEAVNEINTTNVHGKRLKLHLSLCQACTNYLKFGKLLKEKIKVPVSDHKNLNEKIFKKIR